MKTIITLSSILLIILIIFGFWGCPQYRVYTQTMRGKAVLAEAESSRMVKIAEARAQKESAVLIAEADSLRAIGVAAANRIIGESLKGNEAYLHWLWIDGIDRTPGATIYIPTEANLPILEANRLK